jgi:hypothetical protein
MVMLSSSRGCPLGKPFLCRFAGPPRIKDYISVLTWCSYISSASQLHFGEDSGEEPLSVQSSHQILLGDGLDLLVALQCGYALLCSRDLKWGGTIIGVWDCSGWRACTSGLRVACNTAFCTVRSSAFFCIWASRSFGLAIVASRLARLGASMSSWIFDHVVTISDLFCVENDKTFPQTAPNGWYSFRFEDVSPFDSLSPRSTK